MIGIGGRTHYAHRLAFLYMLGELPPNQVDHINRNRTDNRWVNLRAATHSDNCRNHTPGANSSGVTGVYFFKRTGGWMVAIGVNGVNKHLGYFKKKEDAISARRAGEIKYGYPNIQPSHISSADGFVGHEPEHDVDRRHYADDDPCLGFRVQAQVKAEGASNGGDPGDKVDPESLRGPEGFLVHGFLL